MDFQHHIKRDLSQSFNALERKYYKIDDVFVEPYLHFEANMCVWSCKQHYVRKWKASYQSHDHR